MLQKQFKCHALRSVVVSTKTILAQTTVLLTHSLFYKLYANSARWKLEQACMSACLCNRFSKTYNKIVNVSFFMTYKFKFSFDGDKPSAVNL